MTTCYDAVGSVNATTASKEDDAATILLLLLQIYRAAGEHECSCEEHVLKCHAVGTVRRVRVTRWAPSNDVSASVNIVLENIDRVGFPSQHSNMHRQTVE
jgi:hypothetical protein